MTDVRMTGTSGLVDTCRGRQATLRRLFCLLVSFAGVGVSADAVPVTNQPYVWLNSEGATVTADYLLVPTLPQTSATVLFHLDASQTNGWSVGDGGEVTEVPSLTGERKLVNVKPSSWKEEESAQAPRLLTNVAALNGGNALDFGALGSRRVLTFDGNGQTLAGFRSVVVVYDSEEGGGFFLGGAPGTENPGPYAFHRGSSWVASNGSDFTRWDNPLLYNGYGLPALGSHAWHDGVPTAPQFVGFKGDWEVVSFCQPKNVSLETSGLGGGDVRAGYARRSGGMKIAEILFYDQCLSDAERKAVEAYLQKKWFGRSVAGYEGRAATGLVYAHLNTNFGTNGGLGGHSERNVVAVPADSILEVDELKGGHSPISSLEKTGAGTLALGESKGYGAPVRLSEGELSFPRKAIPTAIPQADDAFLHIDASAGNMTTVAGEDGEHVTHWRNESTLPWRGEAVYLHSTNDATRPLLVAHALNGKPVVDFGPAVARGGFRLDLTTNDMVRLTAVDGVVTTIAVVDTTDGGGSLFGFCDHKETWYTNPFTRMSNGVTKFRNGFADPGHNDSYLANNGLTMADCVHYVDGLRVDPTRGYPTPGWHVVAIQTPGCRVTSVGAQDGGFRLAELVSWRKPLSEAETRDAIAYLAAKWLKRRVPGYAAPEGTSDNVNGDVRDLTTADGTAIRVDGTGVARVANLTAEGDFVKRGSGRLQLTGTIVMGGSVRVEDGSVEVVTAPDVTGDCELARDPSFHVDASDPSTMKTTEVDGRKYVMMWFDADGRDNAAVTPNVANSPWLNETDTLNGKPVVDFGEWKSRRSLHFCRALNGIRSAFVVLGSQNGGGDLLGSSFFPYEGASSGLYDFMRGERKVDNVVSLTHLFYGGYFTFFGPIYINGVKGTQTSTLNGGYELIDVHPTAGAHASAFSGTRLGSFDSLGSNHNGGQRLAEVVLYERVLSERERLATRNFLMKKWFNAAAQPLPDPTSETVAIKAIEVAGTTSLGGGNPITTADIYGTGTVVKVGADVLSAGDLADFTGKVEVTEGTLRLTRGYEPLPPELPTEGLTLHLDASRGVTCDATGNIASWANLVEDQAVHHVAAVNASDARATLDSLGFDYAWLKSVNMPRFSSFRFEDADGQLTTNDNVRSIFWVLGSQAGGGFILGGSFDGNRHYGFHRGNNGDVTNPSAAILYNDYGDACVIRQSDWYMNGEKIDPFRKGFSGNWDVVSMISKGQDYATQAEGLAADARYFYNKEQAARLGSQRLAELIMYETILTDDRRRQVEAYLANKWGVGTGRRTADRMEIDVSVAAGATFDLGGTNQHVVAISGAGTVRNGSLTVAGLDASQPVPTMEGDLVFEDGATWTIATAEDRPLSVGGVLTFGTDMRIVLPDVTQAADIVDRTVVVATGAKAYVGLANLDDVTVVTAAVPQIDVRVSFRVTSAGDLVLRGLGRGMCLVIR